MATIERSPDAPRRGRKRKASNLIEIDFAKGRSLPEAQKEAGLNNDLFRLELERLVATQRRLTENLALLCTLLEQEVGR